MPISRAKYKRVPDLYVVGTTVTLLSGDPVWIQVVNPFERDECVHDAQVARARLVLALKEDGDERAKVDSRFFEVGREKTIESMAASLAQDKLGDILNEIASDPEWKERNEILQRTDPDDTARPLEPVEVKLLEKTQSEYLAEISAREKSEHDYHVQRLERASDEEVLEEYIEMWINRRGSELASAEYFFTELWYSARCCEGKQMADGQWDHSACEGHAVRLFENRAEIRELPEDFIAVLRDGLQHVSMTVREAKNSDRQGSSSDSSPLPSEPAESTPSTPDETPKEPLGTSPQPSLTD